MRAKETLWKIGPSAAQEATYKMEPLTAGDYTVTVRFTIGTETVTTGFTVEEPKVP